MVSRDEDRGLRADQAPERGPALGRRVVGDGGEHRDRRVEAEGEQAAFRYRGLRAGERVPDGVVEGVHGVHPGSLGRRPDEAFMTVVLDETDARASTSPASTTRASRSSRMPIEPELVVALRDTIRRLQGELGIAPLGTAAEGHSTLRMYNLLAKDPVFQAMPVHPAVLPIVERLLDRGCLLSGMTAIDIGPGEDAQPMHGDDIVMSRHLTRPHAPMMVTSMWALTDFTAENGGTRYIPGSHRMPVIPHRELDRHDVRSLEMPAGSVMIFHGSLWHGGGPNTQRRRLAARRERPVLPGLRPPAAEPVPRGAARGRGDVLGPAARAARLPALQGRDGPHRRAQPG